MGLVRWGEKYDPSLQGIPAPEYHEEQAKWTARGAHRLLDYALPTSKGSVVYSHMFNKLFNCQPRMFSFFPHFRALLSPPPPSFFCICCVRFTAPTVTARLGGLFPHAQQAFQPRSQDSKGYLP